MSDSLNANMLWTVFPLIYILAQLAELVVKASHCAVFLCNGC